MKNISDLLPRQPAPAPKNSGKPKREKKTVAKPKHRWAVGFVVASVLLVLLGSTGLAVAHYSDKILPGVSVAGINLGGKTRAEAAELLRQDVAKLSVVIQNGDTAWQPTLSQLGVQYDVTETVNDAYSVGRLGSVQQRIGAFSGKRVPLKYRYDTAATDAFIFGIVHATSKAPVDAALVVQNGSVQISPEQLGQTTGVENAAQRVRAVLGHPGAVSLAVSQIILHPQITATNLAAPLQQARAMTAIPVTITSAKQNLSPTASQKAGWLSFTADPAAHTVRVAFSSAKVQGFVASIVKSLTISPQPQEIGVNLDENGAQSIIQAGQNGQTVANGDALSSGLLAALTAGTAFTGVATTAPVPFAIKHMNIYDRWIDVNLTKQRMTAYQKGTPVLSTLISSGVASHPTVIGTFHIYGKTRSQTMSGGSRLAGDYYSLPNVQWISWFYGDYSIHGTYWHHNFGHPMSHGCVNATNADASFIYNWAPIGTAVVIHK